MYHVSLILFVIIGNVPGIHHEVWEKVKTDKHEYNLCKYVTNEDLIYIKDKEVTFAVVTRAETVRQERKISPVKVPDAGNDNVASDSFKIAHGECPILKVFFDKAEQTPSSDLMKNPCFMKGVCCIDTFRERKHLSTNINPALREVGSNRVKMDVSRKMKKRQL